MVNYDKWESILPSCMHIFLNRGNVKEGALSGVTGVLEQSLPPDSSTGGP